MMGKIDDIDLLLDFRYLIYPRNVLGRLGIQMYGGETNGAAERG
jgi:hypothetical protein